MRSMTETQIKEEAEKERETFFKADRMITLDVFIELVKWRSATQTLSDDVEKLTTEATKTTVFIEPGSISLEHQKLLNRISEIEVAIRDHRTELRRQRGEIDALARQGSEMNAYLEGQIDKAENHSMRLNSLGNAVNQINLAVITMNKELGNYGSLEEAINTLLKRVATLESNQAWKGPQS
jgi:chromosome segregation ATPase